MVRESPSFCVDKHSARGKLQVPNGGLSLRGLQLRSCACDLVGRRRSFFTSLSATHLLSTAHAPPRMSSSTAFKTSFAASLRTTSSSCLEISTHALDRVLDQTMSTSMSGRMYVGRLASELAMMRVWSCCRSSTSTTAPSATLGSPRNLCISSHGNILKPSNGMPSTSSLCINVIGATVMTAVSCAQQTVDQITAWWF